MIKGLLSRRNDITTDEMKSANPRNPSAMMANKSLNNFQRLSLYKRKLPKDPNQDYFNMFNKPRINDIKLNSKLSPTSSTKVNPWLIGGSLGNKDSVLFFRTCALSSANTSVSATMLQTPKSCTGQASPSSSSSDITITKNEKLVELYKSAGSNKILTPLSKTLNVQKSKKNSFTSPFYEESEASATDVRRSHKSKKRHLESSSSSSSISSTDYYDLENGKIAKDVTDSGNSSIKANSEDTSTSTDKENIIVFPIDKNELPGALFNITYKFMNTETRLLRKILSSHGLTELTTENTDFNLLWTGTHVKADLLRNLLVYQRVNHFPRSYELTRKDRLYKNIEKMQHFRGFKHFNIVPQSFLLPGEYKELVTAHNKCRGPWIVKPVASSRGRGIFIVNSPDQIPSDEQVVVAKYIADPLCIDGHKCDIRIYVAVTSFDPLIIYIYEEGLVRLATVKYDRNAENLWNPCMHLCNYSINKYHTDYIKSSDADDEDVGHKWTLSALLRHLRDQGCNTKQLMLNIEDLIIKAILSCTQPIVSACRMFVPNIHNCFELYGFDILIDDSLKPWLLEINLSPSLGCDSPLDTKVKACLLTDLLTLIGIPAISPLMKASYDNKYKSKHNTYLNTTPPSVTVTQCRRVNSADFIHSLSSSSQGSLPTTTTGIGSNSSGNKKLSTLTPDELRIVRYARAQHDRRGGFIRIFPTVDTLQKYSGFLDPVTGIPTAATSSGNGTNLMIIPHNYNLMLHNQLYPPNLIMKNPIAHPTLNVISDRIKKYERALDNSLPIIMGPRVHEIPQCVHDQTQLRQQMRRLIENGHEFTTLQARKLFGQYLEFVLKRLSFEPRQQHEELILKFLYRISVHMKNQYLIRNITQKVLTKDRSAMLAKILGDYLHLYNKDTEAYVDTFDRMGMVPTKTFEEFVSHAHEHDIESVLALHTNLSQDMNYLYNSCSLGVPPTPPIPVGQYGFLKALPSMAPACPNKENFNFIHHQFKMSDNKRFVHAGSQANAMAKLKNDKSQKLSPIKKKVSLNISKEK